MLSGKHRKFCEGIVSGLGQGEAYQAAFPKSTLETARKNAPRMFKFPEVVAEIAAMRKAADMAAGGAVLTLIEKRKFLARVVRACVATLDRKSDLWQSIKTTEDGIEMKLPGKIEAIREDNDLAGEGSEAEANDALAGLLTRIRK